MRSQFHPSPTDYAIDGACFLVVLAIGGVVRPLEKFWQTILAFLADVAVMVAVSLVTKPKPVGQPRVLVWSLANKPLSSS